MSKSFFTTLFRFDRFHRFALIRFTFCIGSLDYVFWQRSKYKHVRHCDCYFNQIVQFNIIILCKYPKINMHFLHTVLDIFPMDLTMKIC